MRSPKQSVGTRLLLCGAVAASLASSIDRSTSAAPASQEPTETASPAPDETPIVDPVPKPHPSYLPALMRGVDRTEPPPLTPEVGGFVAVLSRDGRSACAPATHALLAEPEGSSPNHAVAVVYADPDRADLNLDLYVSDFVLASGLEDLAPPACRQVARRLIAVRRLTVVEVPPGQSPSGEPASVGKRTRMARE